MRKFILPACLFFCSFLVKAQESKWSVSFTPAIVQRPGLRYGIQPGFEYKLNDRLSVLTEIAFTAGNSKDSSYSASCYFRIKPELRYTLFQTRGGFDVYTGLQFSYSYRKWKDLNGGNYFDKELYSDSTISYTRAGIRSPVFTSSLQFGALIPIGNHFNIDFFIGMGVRTIFTDYSGVENANKEQYNRAICKIVPVSDPAYWINGTVTRFHSNLGIRFLYRF